MLSHHIIFLFVRMHNVYLICFVFTSVRKDANSGLLSNFEVLELLRSRGATQDPLGSFGSATHSECKVNKFCNLELVGHLYKFILTFIVSLGY